jgi:hypothetical protein
MTVRDHCKDLLGAEDLSRYRKLCDKYNDGGNRQTDWSDLLEKFYPEDEDIGSNDYKGQANLCDDFDNKSKDMREKVIAYDQLKAFSLYLELSWKCRRHVATCRHDMTFCSNFGQMGPCRRHIIEDVVAVCVGFCRHFPDFPKSTIS